MTPAPTSYDQDDSAIKLQRYNNIHLGTDVKVTAKNIKLTPGPGHYIDSNMGYNRTHNVYYKYGWDLTGQNEVNPQITWKHDKSHLDEAANFHQVGILKQEQNPHRD